MYNFRSILTVAAGLSVATFAFAEPHAELTKTVATYKPGVGFNQVVGETRFVGYFIAGPDRCDVALFTARADDEALATPARRTLLPIAAGGRSEIEVSPDSALAIACTIDADAIKIAPQVGRLRSAGL